MPQQEKRFMARRVDEQFEQFAHASSPLLTTPNKQVVESLRTVYDEHIQQEQLSLERMRQRLSLLLAAGQQEKQATADESTPAEYEVAKVRVKHDPARLARPGRPWVRMLEQGVAVLLALAIVVGWFAISHLPRSNGAGMPSQVPAQSLSNIYATNNFFLYKFDVKSRAVAWSKPIFNMTSQAPSELSISGNVPADGSGVVYVSFSKGPMQGLTFPYVSAFRASNGTQLWSARLDSGKVSEFDLGTVSQPVFANGLVYVAARGGKVYALDATTGSRRWVYTPQNVEKDCIGVPGQAHYTCYPAEPAPVIVDHGVVYIALAQKVLALNAATGSRLWTASIKATLNLQDSPVLSNGIVYALASSEDSNNLQYGYLYAFLASTGQQLWVSSKFIQPSEPVATDGTVYVLASSTIYAFHASTGSLFWHMPLHMTNIMFGSLVGVVDGKALLVQGFTYKKVPGGVSPTSTMLFAFDPSNGSLRWQRKITANEMPLRVVVTADRIYIATSLLALEILDLNGRKL